MGPPLKFEPISSLPSPYRPGKRQKKLLRTTTPPSPVTSTLVFCTANAATSTRSKLFCDVKNASGKLKNISWTFYAHGWPTSPVTPSLPYVIQHTLHKTPLTSPLAGCYELWL